MEERIPEIYLINSILPNRNENDEEFIKIEFDYTFTNIQRLEKLLRFLLKSKEMGIEFQPILLHIRDEKEDISTIYENSDKLNKSGFVKFKQPEISYWSRFCCGCGV